MSDELGAVVEALNIGDKYYARELLEPILTSNPGAEAWFLASKAADSAGESIEYLQKVLSIDPNHAEARKMLSMLGIDVADLKTLATDVPTQSNELFSQLAAEQQPDQKKEKQVSKESIRQASAVEVERSEGSNRVAVTGVYEMLWDCKFCGVEKNLGKTHQFCPNCGSPQDPSWRYFPSDDEKIAVKDHKYVGVDVTCPSCDSVSSGNSEYCGRCGAPLSEAAKVKLQQSRIGEGLGKEDLQTRLASERDAEVGRLGIAAQQAKGKKGPSKIVWGIGIAVIAAIAFIAVVLFSTKDVSVYLSDYRWEREIQIEELKREAETQRGKCNGLSLPAGAYNLDTRWEQVDTRRVQDGETCTNRQVDQGDGSFRSETVCEPNYREEPVHGDVCYYNINRWRDGRSVEATGSKTDTMVWPQVDLKRTGECVGCEREGEREERFIFILQGDKDKKYECAVPKEQWETTSIETTFTLEVSVIGDNPKCDTLKPLG